jgi:hypothetical protein
MILCKHMHMSTLSIAPFISMYVRYSDYVFMSANDSVLSMYFTLRYAESRVASWCVCISKSKFCYIGEGLRINIVSIVHGHGHLVYILVMVV